MSKSYIQDLKTLKINLHDLGKKKKPQNIVKKQPNSNRQYKNVSMNASLPIINFQKLHKSQEQRRKTLKPSYKPANLINVSKKLNYTTRPEQENTIENFKISTTFDESERRIIFTKRSTARQSQIFTQKQPNQKTKSFDSQTTIQTVSQNFLESFRIVLNQLIQTYFLHTFLKKKIKYMPFQIWLYIIKMSGIQINQSNQSQYQDQMQYQMFVRGITQMCKGQFKKSQIQQMTKKCFSKKQIIFYVDFQKFMTVQKDFMDFLVERSYQKKYGNLNPTKLVNTFFRVLVELADLEKKLIMICQANQNQLIRLMISISVGQLIRVTKLADFLDENQNTVTLGLKLTQAKLTNFLDRTLGSKHSKFQFMKWLKINQKNSN